MKAPWKYARAVLVAALAVAVPVTMASCASERPARSFVQPNVLKKADLDGTYYYIQTVTEAPPTNGAMFIGQSSSLMKVKFDVQEEFLYARRAYEQIGNSEDAAAAQGAKYNSGQPLAAWRITSHFDIIRDYNSTTGEQTNRIIESQERPWQERDFLRVDWSMNLVTDYVGIGVDIFFSDGQPHVEPVSYWESDPTKRDALHMEHLSADNAPEGLKAGEMSYLDITNEMIVTPQQLSLDGMSFPMCFLYYSQDDCASQQVKIRHSFAKIGPTHSYQPQDWDGNKMQLFGVWDVGLRRLSYNREYGVTNTGAVHRAARFNIWSQDSYADQTHLKDPTKGGVKVQKIPYYAEGSRPITFSGDKRFPENYQDFIYPPELFGQFAEIVRQWNEAMKTAVVDATQQKSSSDVFVACHNPVAPGDDAACSAGLVPDQDANGTVILDKQGNPILHARQGDPRHSCVFWVNEQQNAGPLGYGPPLFDPVTGETISGQAYIYGAAVETYAVRSRDLMLLLNGDVTENDFIAGQPAKTWVAANKNGNGPTPASGQLNSSANRSYSPQTSHLRSLSNKDLMAMSKSMDFDWAKAFSKKNGYPALDPTSIGSLNKSMADRERAIYQGYFSNFKDTRDDQLAALKGTPIETMMMSPEMLAAHGISPMRSWKDLTEGEKTLVSPMRSKALAASVERNRLAAEMNGVDFMTFSDSGLTQRLKYYLNKYGTLADHADAMRVDLTQTIFLAVTLHEVGHNMGCRHNFRGSYDAMNYFPTVKAADGTTTPGYWDLRVGAIHHPDVGMAPSDGKLHPRYVNTPGGKLTQYEIDNQIQETQYSSIMDYGSEFNSDIHGLGLYDKALIKFSYAGYVEVFTDTKKNDSATQYNIAALHNGQSSYGFPSPLGTGAGLSAIAYQTYPSLFTSGTDGIYKRADVPYTNIQSQQLDPNTNLLVDSVSGNPLVPYYFCSDEFVGNLTCQRFDSGADAYEQATDIISRYKNFYLMNNFKRDRQSFHTTDAYLSRIAGRYFDIIREQLVWYVLLRADFQNFLSENAQLSGSDPAVVDQQENSFFVDENGWGNFTAAVALGYEMMGDVISTPSAGRHGKETLPDGTAYWKQYNDDPTPIPPNPDASPRGARSVGLLDGKYLATTWDFTACGYYWADECQTRIGYLLDKEIALDTLSQSQAYFTGRDTSTDVRQYAIGYVLPFKSQLEEKLGAMFANDMSSFAPSFQTLADDPTQVNDTPQLSSWLMDDPTAPKGDLIDPQSGFTLNLFAGVYSLAAFPSTFDHDFIDNTSVFVIGNGEASTTDAVIQANGTTDASQLVGNGGSKEWFVVTDPSGKTYAAHSVQARSTFVLDSSAPASSNYSTKTVALRADMGVRMLEHLQMLSNAVSAASSLPDTDSTKAQLTNEYQRYRQNIEVMRSLHNQFGYGPYATERPAYY
jgi:hypothetical protein